MFHQSDILLNTCDAAMYKDKVTRLNATLQEASQIFVWQLLISFERATVRTDFSI